MKPFYFGVVCWGEEFRTYFLDFCLASLLAPRNIPMLENKTGSRFLICTTADDWAAMREHAMFRLLAKHIEPVWLEIEGFPDERSKMRVMSDGHRAIAETMHGARVYGSFIYPDTVFADGVVEEAISGKKREKGRLGELPALGQRRVSVLDERIRNTAAWSAHRLERRRIDFSCHAPHAFGDATL